MNIAFTLSMPGNNSWNGKWSGEGQPYVVVKEFDSPPVVDGKPIVGQRFGYNFGDGWYAAVTVKEVDADDARRLKKLSAGFCGYNWMIDSILDYGKIYADHQKPAKVEPEAAMTPTGGASGSGV